MGNVRANFFIFYFFAIHIHKVIACFSKYSFTVQNVLKKTRNAILDCTYASTSPLRQPVSDANMP